MSQTEDGELPLSAGAVSRQGRAAGKRIKCSNYIIVQSKDQPMPNVPDSLSLLLYVLRTRLTNSGHHFQYGILYTLQSFPHEQNLPFFWPVSLALVLASLEAFLLKSYPGMKSKVRTNSRIWESIQPIPTDLLSLESMVLNHSLKVEHCGFSRDSQYLIELWLPPVSLRLPARARPRHEKIGLENFMRYSFKETEQWAGRGQQVFVYCNN